MALLFVVITLETQAAGQSLGPFFKVVSILSISAIILVRYNNVKHSWMEIF